MGHRAAARRAEQAAGARTGEAALRAGAALERAGAAVERHGTTSAPAVGAAVGTTVGAVLDAADTVQDVAVGVGRGVRHGASGLVDVVTGLVEEPAVRTGAALDALRGIPVSPPAAHRRWPWALTAALVGAAAGAAVAYVLRAVEGTDAPGAQEPHELQAVVDLPAGGATLDEQAEDRADVLGTPPSPA